MVGVFLCCCSSSSCCWKWWTWWCCCTSMCLGVKNYSHHQICSSKFQYSSRQTKSNAMLLCFGKTTWGHMGAIQNHDKLAVHNSDFPNGFVGVPLFWINTMLAVAANSWIIDVLPPTFWGCSINHGKKRNKINKCSKQWPPWMNTFLQNAFYSKFIR